MGSNDGNTECKEGSLNLCTRPIPCRTTGCSPILEAQDHSKDCAKAESKNIGMHLINCGALALAGCALGVALVPCSSSEQKKTRKNKKSSLYRLAATRGQQQKT